LASCGMEVETVGLTGFLVTMMAVVMRFGGVADQWWDVVCCSCSCQGGVSCAQLT
jgi:hypothetical protein